MSRPPVSSIFVSAILLAAVVAVVSWQAGNVYVPVDPPTKENVAVRVERPVENVTPDCADVEVEMLERVEFARQCDDDSECVIFDYGYPIQCMTSVNRAEIPDLRRHYRRYHESCEFRVYYDCPTGEARRIGVCNAGRCEVELLGIESLRNETLDYLNQ